MKKHWTRFVLTGVSVFIAVFIIAACGDIENTSKMKGESNSREEKGSISNPYSLGDSFEITAYEVVPFSAYTPEGRQVIDPISFKISNIRILEQQIYSVEEDGKQVEHNNYYLIAFDLEILDSSISDTITFNLDYLHIYNLNSNGQEGYTLLGKKAHIPDEYMVFDWQTLMPLTGAAWSFADVIKTDDDKDLAYIMFNYCGEDREFHDIYVKAELE